LSGVYPGAPRHLRDAARRSASPGGSASPREPGDFTQILYFTSEQDAQRFEPEPLTDTDEPAQQERRGLMTNLRSFDLREPQMLVPPIVVTY
jgi:hypothetical protein